MVRPPCEKVQGPLQLWQARHFVEKLRWNDGWKIEIRLKKGIGNPRHFVVKLPGPMADSLRLEPLHFVVNALGFWETCNMLWFCWSIPLVYNSIFEIQTNPSIIDLPGFCFSISLSSRSFVCVASICFKRACLIICCIATPPNTPLQNLRPERLQYGLVCCCLLS